jgi:hypothetical protein
VPLFPQTSLGGGVGRLKHEALREEVHRFDGCNHTPTMDSFHALCCTAAMQEIHVGTAHDGTRAKPTSDTDLRLGDRRKNARVISGRRAVLETISLCG